MNFLRIIHNEYKDMFERVYECAVPLIKDAFNLLIKMYRENTVLPIVRNYSINDFFNISKNILFAISKYSYSQCASIATDSKYLYILLSGINGGMLKVGSGFEDTDRGRVYLYKSYAESVEDTCQWVFCQNKLYLKSNSTEFGYLSIIDPETFQNISQVKLLLPESSQHSAIKKKNENYVLLSDGEKLNVIILEPVLNTGTNLKKEEKENKEKDIKEVKEVKENKEVVEKIELEYMKSSKDVLISEKKEPFLDKFYMKDNLNINEEEQPQYSEDEEGKLTILYSPSTISV